MKIYISVDIEGVAGITHWDEARKNHSDYANFCRQMNQEAVAACRGAIDAGAQTITVKDAHATGRNLDLMAFPECVELIRGWSGHPFCMFQELDESYDAALCIGYHSPAGAESNPLAHTLNTHIDWISLNGVRASEYLIHAYAAAYVGVPVVFVSGDQALCSWIQEFNPQVSTVPVSQGIGESTRSIHPQRALNAIETGVKQALQQPIKDCRLALPETFTLEIRYQSPTLAYKNAYYPGAHHLGDRTVGFTSADYFEVLRFLRFVT
jgi:D-amino peptidase